MKKILITLLLCICVLLQGCGASKAADTTSQGAAWIEFWLECGESLTLDAPDEQTQIMYHLKPGDADIHWTSSDETVATVDAYGVVTAVGAGKCTVTAEVGMVTSAGQDWSSVITSEVQIRCEFSQ